MFRLWHIARTCMNKMCYQLVLIVLALSGVNAKSAAPPLRP